MEFNSKFKISIHIVSLLAIVAIVILSLYCVYVNDIEDMPAMTLISVGIDIFAIVACLLTYLAIMFDGRSGSKEILLGMILLEAVLLISDIASWVYDGDPASRDYAYLACNVITVTILVIAIMFWYYEMMELKVPREDSRIWGRIPLALFTVGIVATVSNLFTGCLFSIDAGGNYIHGELYFLCSLIPILIFLFSLVVMFKINKDAKSRLTSMLHIIIPIIALFIQNTVYGLSLLYSAMALVILSIYGNFYVSRGVELAKTEAELTEQRFNVMFSQIQPHFLYNALTSIMNIKGNPQETRDAIADFGSYLRGNLNTITCGNPIPFSKELDHLETYISLEKLRFKEKLNIVWHINDTRFVIPALTVQMMVENAIKHGVTQKEEGGTIHIVAEVVEDGHMVKIIDDGVGFNPNGTMNDGKAHVGISSTRERLRTMVSGTLTIRSTIGRGTTVTIFIPDTAM